MSKKLSAELTTLAGRDNQAFTEYAVDFGAFGAFLTETYATYQTYGIGASKAFLRMLRAHLNVPEVKTMFFREHNMKIEEWFFKAFNIDNRFETYSIFHQTTTNDPAKFHLAVIDLKKSLIDFGKTLPDVYGAAETQDVEKDLHDAAVAAVDAIAEELKERDEKIKANAIEQTKTPQHMKAHANVKTEVEKESVKSVAQFSLNIPLNEIVNESVKQYIDSSDILKNIQTFIKAEAQKLQPNVVKVGDNKLGTIEGQLHHKFADVAELANRERKVFLAGPAGTGKTTLAAQIAKGFSLDFAHISCTAGMSEAHLLGRMTAHGEYLESELVRVFENGGVFLFDEIDAADPNTLLVVNSALANGVMSVPNRVAKPTAHKHKDFICICAANTWGTGSIEYSGRAQLDAAFLDRFVGSKVMISYDVALEEKIAGERKNELKAIHKIRENIMKSKIRRVMSTRAVESMARHMAAGYKFAAFLDMYFLGWSAEEKTKAMQDVVI